jgi:hypothetical protein
LNVNFSQNTLRVEKQKNILTKAQFTRNIPELILRVETMTLSFNSGEIKALKITRARETRKPIKVIGHKVETFLF